MLHTLTLDKSKLFFFSVTLKPKTSDGGGDTEITFSLFILILILVNEQYFLTLEIVVGLFLLIVSVVNDRVI